MKRAILCSIVGTLSVWGQQPVRSPEIAPDRKVTFRLHAPSASSVLLTGEFLKGSKPLEKGEGGVWSLTVGPVPPEIYYYNFTIDGVRTIDPGNPGVKFGSTPSTIQSVLEVPAGSPAFYDPRPVPHGEIRTHWYESKALRGTRRLTVYTPPGYDSAAGVRYPVLYLFHGANADETAWTRLGRVNLIMDNLLAAPSPTRKTKPMLIVMPFGYGVPPGTAQPPGANTAAFGRDLIQDVIPFVESHYRTLPNREHRAIAGLSMGGEQSLNIGLHHLELFSYVGGFSAGIRQPKLQPSFGDVLADPKTANQKLKLLWIGCGSDDSLFPGSESLAKMLDQAGIKHTFHKSDGAHTWTNWRRYLSEFAPLLF
jgi:enterochelin esterase family protein